MTIFRAIQGFVGGAMVPTVFATGFSMFDGKRRAMIPAILGAVSTLAPTLGPTVGGWITDTMSWHWLFFINIIPGAFIAVALPLLGKVDEPNLSMLKRIDWLHVGRKERLDRTDYGCWIWSWIYCQRGNNEFQLTKALRLWSLVLSTQATGTSAGWLASVVSIEPT